MNELRHFAIHCDDVPRAARFYEAVFGWTCVAYGGQAPQEFMQIKTADGKPIGGVQSRKFNAAERDVFGWECSIDVTDVDATTRAAERAGAKVVMRRTAIPGVGWLSKFIDTEGNLFCAVQYDSSAR
jgi:predicted enzyme related to lactoylglutathione lyase